jgi:hypothetical protein
MVRKGLSSVWWVLAVLLGGGTLSSSQKAVSVTKVSSTEEFKAAVIAGAPHVHITKHLNLTTFQPGSNPTFPGPYLQSITVSFS